MRNSSSLFWLINLIARSISALHCKCQNSYFVASRLAATGREKDVAIPRQLFKLWWAQQLKGGHQPGHWVFTDWTAKRMRQLLFFWIASFHAISVCYCRSTVSDDSRGQSEDANGISEDVFDTRNAILASLGLTNNQRSNRQNPDEGFQDIGEGLLIRKIRRELKTRQKKKEGLGTVQVEPRWPLFDRERRPYFPAVALPELRRKPRSQTVFGDERHLRETGRRKTVDRWHGITVQFMASWIRSDLSTGPADVRMNTTKRSAHNCRT